MRDDRGLFFVEILFAPQQIQGEVFGSLCQPGSGVFGNAVVRPGLQGANQRFLDDVFGHLQAFNAKEAGQHRDKLA